MITAQLASRRPGAPMLAVLVCLIASPGAGQTLLPPEPPEAAAGEPEDKPPAPPAPPPTQEPPTPWWERLTLYGDFRTRYEGVFQDGLDAGKRLRFRFRLGLKTTISEGLDFNVRVASGDASDVTSTNQSLTDFLNRKPVNIDQIGLTYRPAPLRNLTLGFGKYAFPVTRTQMVWDDDVNWEGAYEQLSFRGDTAVTLQFVGVQSPMNEVGDGEDAFMFGEYGHAAFKLGRHRLQVSVADYAFTNPDQIAVALDEGDVIRTQSTNALRRDSSGDVVGFVSGFHLIDTIAELTFATGRTEYPVVALADFVVNTRAADDQDTGLWLVGTYGTATAPRTLSASYTFARVERDAVLSAYNFSDMGPATNVRMNMLTFSYVPRRRVNLDVTAILTKLLDVQPGQPNPLLKRIQVDARIVF